MDASLNDLSAAAAVAAMQCGDITAEDYARALLARAEELRALNAFITLDPEQVLGAARAADKARQRGDKLGMLHGLPFPVKDSVLTKSLRTTAGTRALEKFQPTDDAEVLRRLFAQGAILMGKTNLDELSYDFTSDNTIFGAVHNPYDTSRSPGGSSGGSAVTVAARMAPMAIAEDTLGSIRLPASMCGIVGLRPSYGRYPDQGVLPLTERKLDQTGALSRCVSDLALFDKAVVEDDSTEMAEVSLAGVRIGVSPDYFVRDLSDEILKVWSGALDRLKTAGATIVEAEIPPIALDAQPVVFVIIGYDTVPAMSGFLEHQHVGVTFDQMLAQASPKLQSEMHAHALPPARPSAGVYEACLRQRQRIRDAMHIYFVKNGIDALALPPNLIPPPKIGDEGPVHLAGQEFPFYVAMAHNVALGSCASLPGLILPAGMTAGGLPVGIEFDGPEGSDRRLLSVGLSLEKALGPIPAPKM